LPSFGNVASCLPAAAGFNALLRYLDPLVIALALNAEPLLGSLMGFAAGVSPAPGGVTYAGGALVVSSCTIVIVAAHRREQDEHERVEAAGKIRSAMETPLEEF
jgi:drug/metabolite transporter (DMT)-like permease